jgi:heme o synthase
LLPHAIRSVAALIRLNVSLSVTVSAFAAWIISRGNISTDCILPLAAVFLLSSGASSLNQILEKEQDAKMERTRSRPIPSGFIGIRTAVFLTVLFLFAGCFLLIMDQLWITLILGIVNVIWYDLFYTWLKKKTAFAVVPGAMSGVIPVWMGWSAAGGWIFDDTSLMLAAFLFIWQVPHFWLLMLKYAEDYRLAGFPVMTDIMEERQFRNIIMAWMIAATGTSLAMTLAGFWIHPVTRLIIVLMNITVLSIVFFHLYIFSKRKFGIMFALMNLFLLLVLCLLIFEKIVF